MAGRARGGEGRREAESTRMREHYDIEYARFFNYPISPSAIMASPPAVVKTLSKSRLLRNGGGTWLSASSPASLHIFTDHTTCLSLPSVVLVVSLRKRVHEIFKDVSGIMTPSNNLRSENKCQSHFATMSREHHGVQHTYPGESPNEYVGASTLLPQSFTEFLIDGFTEVQHEPSTVAEKIDLKTYIASYMSTSFNDMLNTLEQVISDMGGDLSLPL